MIEDLSWNLTSAQMFYLLVLHNKVFNAYKNDDMAYLVAIENSAEYRALFGDMSFDEAFDRYECTFK